MEKCIIVAAADNYAIGRNNALLWHLPEDLKYFKAKTLGSPIIMGYMTYLSIGRPLPGRKNIVISLFPWPDAPEGVSVVDSLEEAYSLAESIADAPGGTGKCFVTGGGYTYREAMEFSDTLYITAVHTSIEDADTFFPEVDPLQWELSEESPTSKDDKSSLEYNFRVYRRKTNIS